MVFLSPLVSSLSFAASAATVAVKAATMAIVMMMRVGMGVTLDLVEMMVVADGLIVEEIMWKVMMIETQSILIIK